MSGPFFIVLEIDRSQTVPTMRFGIRAAIPLEGEATGVEIIDVVMRALDATTKLMAARASVAAWKNQY